MQKQLLTIAIVGIIIIGAVTVGGYYLGKVIQKPKTTPTPSSDALIVEPTVSPEITVTPTPSEPVLLPTAPPRTSTSIQEPQVQGQTVTRNSTPVTASTGTTTSRAISIRFVGVPSQIKSGQAYEIGWFVDGPVGMMGSNTKLSSDLNSSSSSGSGSSSSSTSTSQSFGAFQIPQKFQSNVTFSGNSGSVLLRATADVDGKTYTATQTIQLAN